MKPSVFKIIGRFVFLAGIAGLLTLAVSARETEPGITFACYGVDLKIDSQASYNGMVVPSATWALKNLVPGSDKFWDFNDIKPGDHGENTISLHVKKTDAWLCLDFKNLAGSDNNQNEPEMLADGDGLAGSELLSGMEFFGWVDDGDNLFEVGERPLFGTTTQSAVQVLNDTTYAIGDAGSGNSCREGGSRYVGIYWCAGNLSVDLVTAQIACDGSALDNAAQTDSMSVDVSIRALPSRENPQFLCRGSSGAPGGEGSIEGVVYYDKNRNAKRDSSESGLSGWTIKLYKGTGWNIPYGSAVSDATGRYEFTGLPDGVYSIEEIIQSGWNQLTSDYWSVTVSNGSAITGKDFGNAPRSSRRR